MIGSELRVAKQRAELSLAESPDAHRCGSLPACTPAMAVTMETARAVCPQSGSMAHQLETIFLVKINCIKRNRVEKIVKGVYFLFMCFNYFPSNKCRL